VWVRVVVSRSPLLLPGGGWMTWEMGVVKLPEICCGSLWRWCLFFFWTGQERKSGLEIFHTKWIRARKIDIKSPLISIVSILRVVWSQIFFKKKKTFIYVTYCLLLFIYLYSLIFLNVVLGSSETRK
jgi:hypothetical protein